MFHAIKMKKKRIIIYVFQFIGMTLNGHINFIQNLLIKTIEFNKQFFRVFVCSDAGISST